MLKNVNFTKRLDAATKNFKPYKFKFQLAFFALKYKFASFRRVFLQDIKQKQFFLSH